MSYQKIYSAFNLLVPLKINTSVKYPPPAQPFIFYPKFTKINNHPVKTFPGRRIVATFSSVTYPLD